MRHWGYVADHSELETNRLQSAHGRFPARARTFNEYFNFLQTVPHGLPRGILRHHLRCVGRALARAFESNFARARPSDDVAFHVRDRDDGVVKRRENVRDTVMDVFAALGLDDLRLLDAVGTEGKIFRRRRSRGGPFLFLCLRRSLFVGSASFAAALGAFGFLAASSAGFFDSAIKLFLLWRLCYE